jgi:hypothetical protein
VVICLQPRGSEIMMIFTIDAPHVEHASLAQAAEAAADEDEARPAAWPSLLQMGEVAADVERHRAWRTVRFWSATRHLATASPIGRR